MSGNCPESCAECEESEFENDSENAEDGRAWGEHNGAWLLVDVFPVEESDMREGKPVYECIEYAFTESLIKESESS